MRNSVQVFLINSNYLINYYDAVGDTIDCYCEISDKTISDCFLKNLDN